MILNALSPLRYLNAAKFVLVITTILALFAFPYIPKKTLEIYPGSQVWWGAFTDSFSGGNTKFEYMNDDHTAIECIIGDAGSFNMCGNSSVFADNTVVTHDKLLADLSFAAAVSPRISLDLSAYTGAWIEIDYQGPAKFIHFSLQNHEPRESLIKS